MVAVLFADAAVLFAAAAAFLVIGFSMAFLLRDPVTLAGGLFGGGGGSVAVITC